MHWKLGWGVWLLAALLGKHIGNCDSEAANPEYYCLEDYKPIGNVIRQVPLPPQDTQSTSGHIARQCSAACSAEPQCTAFTATGKYSPLGVHCQLLANSSAALPAALQLPHGSEWPSVLEAVTAGDRITLRSTGWLCFRGADLWDEFGEATHAVIHTGAVEPVNLDHGYHCVYGSDVAGTNLQQYTTPIHSPLDCDQRCVSSVGCVVWTFAAAQNGSGQAPYNCFIKADPFKGENGWTGKPKPDIWIQDSQVDCFTTLQDWRELGLILSPAVKTVNYNNTFYTLYPERVTFTEARRACQGIPGGQLAILDTRMEIDTAYRELLSTLSPETGVTSAWVGVMGNNTHFNPAAQNQTGLGQRNNISLSQIGQLQPQPVRDRTASGPETTLHWLNGEAVDPNQLRRLTQHDVWTVHDVIWNQQYVPDSSQYVCGRVLVQAPPTNPTGPVEPSAVLPGLWYFDCDKLAPFICQSPGAPSEPMIGRSVVLDGNTATSAGGGSPNWRMAVAVVVPIVALLLALWQLSRVYRRQVSRLPELIRQQRKRALGQPSWGRMSIVVTDIQGFTNLMRDAPDQMAQALLLHNQVMKHACYDNIGYVLEQEGDSFTLAFHEPTDAVAFTLQVQQALLEQPWPPDILYQDDWDASTRQQQQQAAMGNRYSSDRGSTPSPAPDSPRGRRRVSLSSVFGLGFSRSDSQTGAAVADRHSSEVNGWLSDPNLPFAAPSASGMSYNNTSWSPRGAAGASPSVIRFSRRRAAWLQQLVSPAQQQQREIGSGPVLFQGVRVRMGVASGYVGKGQEVKSSALYKTAQDVSNAANGGQVLMDEPTFTSVKEELWRLGLVTSTGLNYDMLYNASSSSGRSRRSSGMSSSSRDDVRSGSSGSRLLECWNGRRSSISSGGSTRVEHALALDMGAYKVGSSQNHTAWAAPGSSSSRRWPLWTPEAGADLVQQYQQYLQQQLLVDQQSDASDRSDIVTTGITGSSVHAGDIESGFYPPHVSATAQGYSQSSAAAPGLVLLQQRQQHVDPGQQHHEWSVHGGHERVGGVWRAVFGGMLGFKGVGRKRRRSSSNDPEFFDGGITDSADGFPSTWGRSDTAGPSTVRLYQVIAPSLIGRAALFGSDLALPKHWKQLDAPYFAAPGLSSSSTNIAAPAPPPAAAPRPSREFSAQQQRVSFEQQRLNCKVNGSAAAAPAGSDTGGPRLVVDQYLLQQGSVQQLLGDEAGSPASSNAEAVGHSAAPDVASHGHRQAPAGAAAVEEDGNHAPTALVLAGSALSPFAAAAAAASAAAADVADQEAAAAAGSYSSTSPDKQQQQQYRKPPGSPVISNSALLRGMSLRADFALPSVARLGSAAAGGSRTDGLRVSVVRPQYPTVTIVFAMVEGASQLLRCPTLARTTHLLIHRLLLSSMASFPGSYLVRAQEGDLKYMAAFTSPTTAVEWCVTVQEAALYAPYSPEVLGLDCCGVQLDSAGRLVFRGPRFKMGLSEGTPKCILPDHLGRADYHGPFVNQAARFADAAAHGGQIVTDAQLADKVVSYWRMMDNIQRANSRSLTPRKQLQQQQQQSVMLQQQQQQQPQQQQLLPPSPRRLVKSMSVDTGLNQDNNAAAALLAKIQLQRHQKAAQKDQNQQPTTPAPAVAAGVDTVSTPDHIPMPVEVSWLGSFLYKGNPMPLDMVCFTPTALSGRCYPSSTPGGKGVRVAQKVGVWDTVTVTLPAAVDGVQ